MKYLILLMIPFILCKKVNQDLIFNKSGKFRIVQITDTHYGEDHWKDINNSKVIASILAYETPDLVVHTGDMVSGFAWDQKTKPWMQLQWYNGTRIFQDFQQRYMWTLGNHDRQADLNERECIKLDMTHDYSLTQLGPDNIHGASNYVKPLYDAQGNITFYFWMIDTGMENCLGVKGWGCAYPDQVEWFRETAASMIKRDGKIIPGFAFFHIPLHEQMMLANEGSVFGQRGEDVACPSVNTGLFSAFKEMGNIVATSCGHDHDNDFHGNYHGIELYYSRKTGYGCYGPDPGFGRGSRVFEYTLNKDGKVSYETWIRDEWGKKVLSQPTETYRTQNQCADMGTNVLDHHDHHCQ